LTTCLKRLSAPPHCTVARHNMADDVDHSPPLSRRDRIRRQTVMMSHDEAAALALQLLRTPKKEEPKIDIMASRQQKRERAQTLAKERKARLAAAVCLQCAVRSWRARAIRRRLHALASTDVWRPPAEVIAERRRIWRADRDALLRPGYVSLVTTGLTRSANNGPGSNGSGGSDSGGGSGRDQLAPAMESSAMAVMVATRPLAVRIGTALTEPLAANPVLSAGTTLLLVQAQRLADGSLRALVARQGHPPIGWVSWVTKDGSVGLVSRGLAFKARMSGAVTTRSASGAARAHGVGSVPGSPSLSRGDADAGGHAGGRSEGEGVGGSPTHPADHATPGYAPPMPGRVKAFAVGEVAAAVHAEARAVLTAAQRQQQTREQIRARLRIRGGQSSERGFGSSSDDTNSSSRNRQHERSSDARLYSA